METSVYQCMPRLTKLLTDVGPDDPPARAARRALKVRLRAVLHYLKRAQAVSADQVEEIHQLRVWTRRSTAALKLFEPLLPSKKGRRLKKVLRKLRQTAGAVRDLDIIDAQVGQALHGPLAGRLSKQQKSAHCALARLLRRCKKKGRLKRKIKSLRRRIDRRPAHHEQNGVAFAPWCRQRLAPLTGEFVNRASGGARQADAALHQWRLAAKRLKYALELAIAALPQRTWTPLYALLGELQDRLGRVCDALVERQRLRQWQDETGDELERKVLARLDADCRRRLSTAKKQLAQWWTTGRGKNAAALCQQASGTKSAKPWKSR